MKTSPLLHKAWDRLSLYLPLVVMLLLALASWWLVRSMPDLWSAPKEKLVRKDPDYHLRQFVVRFFDSQGHQVRELMGKEAHHFPDNDEMHIEQVTFQSRNETGQRLDAIGHKGVVTGDGERVTMLGDVRAVREATANLPRIELRGERIIALVKAKRLLSDDPVWITRGADTFSANSLDFNIDNGHYQLSGRVLGTLAPRAKAQQP